MAESLRGAHCWRQQTQVSDGSESNTSPTLLSWKVSKAHDAGVKLPHPAACFHTLTPAHTPCPEPCLCSHTLPHASTPCAMFSHPAPVLIKPTLLQHPHLCGWHPLQLPPLLRACPSFPHPASTLSPCAHSVLCSHAHPTPSHTLSHLVSPIQSPPLTPCPHTLLPHMTPCLYPYPAP